MCKKISIILCLFCLLILAVSSFSIFSCAEESEMPFWDFYTLQNYNSDHSLSTARGNWYNTANRENFSDFSLEKCNFNGEISRALKLSVASKGSPTYGSLMFSGLVNADLSDRAAGMRFCVSNPADKPVPVGITYCDTNAIYSCHKSGVYFLETKNIMYRTTPSYHWDSFCSGGSGEVGVVDIPAGFEGYVYIPFSSTTRANMKSEFSRVRLFVGANAGTEQTLYLRNIDYFSTSVDFSGAVDFDYGFDAISDIPITNASSVNKISVGFSVKNRDGYCGKALKADFTGSDGYVQWRINNLWGNVYDSSAYGMRFWAQNPQNDAVEIKIQFGNSYKPCRIKSPYYLDCGSREKRRYITSAASNENVGCITLPANFKGFVYLPYTLSASSETSGHLILSPKALKDITLYFDSFGSFDTEELFEVLWYEENIDVLTDTHISKSLSYEKAMLDDGRGEYLNVRNQNSFAIPVFVGNAPGFCYLKHNDGSIEYVNISNNIFVIPGNFNGKIYIPFLKYQTSLYSLDILKTASSGWLTVNGIGVYNEEIFPLGDANNDGKVDLRDLVRFKRYATDDKVYISANADINLDKRKNTTDIILLKNGLLNSIVDAKNSYVGSGIVEPLNFSVYRSLNSSVQIIAEENVCDHGADVSGKVDSTLAFKKAIFAAEQHGGGTVYVPEGRYLITDTLKIPESVTICGQWKNPDEAPAGSYGSVILAKGNNFGSAAVFEMGTSTGIIGLTVIYPEQNISSPVKYDYTVRVTGTKCYTLENFTVVGAYNGIELGSLTRSCQLYYLKNVYISALNIGITNDKTSDIGRMENVNCSPEYWCNNVILAMNSEQKKAVFEYTRSAAQGMQFYLNDWSIFKDIYIAYMKTGIYFGVSDIEKDRGFNGKFYNVEVFNCDTGIYIYKTKIGGADFTNLKISTEYISTSAIDTSSEYYGTCMFYNTEISGKYIYPIRNNSLVKTGNQGTLEFLSGSIGAYSGVSYGVTVNGGCVTLQDMLFKNPSKHITTSESIISLSVLGCRYNAGRNFKIPIEVRKNCIIDDTQVEPYNAEILNLEEKENKPSSDTVISVTDYGADTSLPDNSEAFTKAFDSLKKTGGTVYIPAGNWRFENGITVPTGVELRGSNATPHMQNAEHASGTILWCFCEPGKDGKPFITLEENSGLRGFSVYYEEQGNNTVEFPYTVRATGKNCYVENITLTNSFNGLDFASCDTSGFSIKGVTGCPVNIGINVGGSAKNGVLKDCHFNPNFSYVLTHNSASIEDRLYGATAFRIGDVDSAKIYGIFAYGYNNGIAFASDGSGGAEKTLLVNCAVDGSETSVRAKQARSVEIVGGQFVSMQSQNEKHCFISENEFNGTVKFYNSNLWGPTNFILKLGGGNTEYHLVNLCTGYGDYSVYMTGGKAFFNSVCFHNKKLFVSGMNTSAEFFGCFTRTYQTLIAPDVENGAAVTVKNSHWA